MLQSKPKFLGSGTYGCAYYPPLPSPEITEEEKITMVSKLTMADEAKDEIEQSRVFRFYDPEGLYGAYPYKVVTPSKVDDPEILQQISLCKVYSDPLQDNGIYTKGVKLLLLPKGELGLDTFINNTSPQAPVFDPKNMITGFQTLSHGFEVYHQNGIYHHDVKSSNIVFSADGSMKMIDFGLSKSIQELEASVYSDDQNISLYLSSYPSFPFYNTIRYRKYSNKVLLQDNYSEAITNMDKLLSIFLPDISQALEAKTSKYRHMADLRAIIAEKNNIIWIAETVDIYPLAILGFAMLVKLNLDPAKIDLYAELVMLPVFLNRSSTKGYNQRLNYWIEAVYNEKKIDQPVFDDLDISYFRTKTINFIYPVKHNRYQNRARMCQLLWNTMAKSMLHPIYYFDAVNVMDYVSDDIIIEDPLLFISALVVAKNPAAEIYRSVNKDEMAGMIAMINSIADHPYHSSGVNTVGYHLETRAAKGTTMEWPINLTFIAAYVTSKVILPALDIFNISLYLESLKNGGPVIKENLIGNRIDQEESSGWSSFTDLAILGNKYCQLKW